MREREVERKRVTTVSGTAHIVQCWCEHDAGAISRQYSSRDLPSELTLKTRYGSDRETDKHT